MYRVRLARYDGSTVECILEGGIDIAEIDELVVKAVEHGLVDDFEVTIARVLSLEALARVIARGHPAFPTEEQNVGRSE